MGLYEEEEVGLYFTALFFDGLSLIPLLGVVTTFIGQILLAIFFGANRVSVIGTDGLDVFYNFLDRIVSPDVVVAHAHYRDFRYHPDLTYRGQTQSTI